jgi:cytochrome P450
MTDRLAYDPYSRAVQLDPYPFYTALREHAPVFRVESMGAWAISRFADVTEVLKTPDLFSSSSVQAFLSGGVTRRALGPLRALSHPGMSKIGRAAGWLADTLGLRSPVIDVLRLTGTRSMISADPPDHTRLRHLVNRGFTPRRIAALEPRIREIARDCLAALGDRSEIDLMRDFAVPLPVIVIAEMLGVPIHRLGDFKRWSDAVVQGVSLGKAATPSRELMAAMSELMQFLKEVFEERRRRPADDLISVLIRDEAGGKLDVRELMLFAVLLLVAGNETTTNLIGNTVHLLLDRPDDLTAVAEDAELIPGLIEESLRYVSPVQGIVRRATRNTEIAGTRLAKGEHVLVLFASANRDSRQFENGDEFLLRRNPKEHIAFGYGIHYCLGASLARLEARIAFEELFTYARGLRRGPGEVTFLQSGILRGPRTLPVGFEPARAAP